MPNFLGGGSIRFPWKNPKEKEHIPGWGRVRCNNQKNESQYVHFDTLLGQSMWKCVPVWEKKKSHPSCLDFQKETKEDVLWMSMIRMITYLIGLVLPMIMDGYGSWTLWRILFHHGSSLVRSNEVASWNHYITYASTSWGFHPWGNLVSNPNHQPGCPKSPYKKNDSMPNQIPNHSRFFFRATKINQQKSTHTSFAFKLFLLQTPPQKKRRLSSPKLRFLSTKKSTGTSSTSSIPPPPPNAVMACHVVIPSPRLHGIRHAGGTQTESEDEARGQRRDKTAGRTRLGGEIFVGGNVPSRKPKRSEKKQTKKKTQMLLLKFVASLVCWLIFFFGGGGGGKRKRLHERGSYSQGREVFWSVGRLESVFCVFLFERKIGLVPTKLEAFEPTTSKKSISTK